MARIDVLPSIEIIRGLKGILDFYVWRGLPCVRAWPRYRPARQTDASLAAALTFGAIVKAYALLANQVLAAYRQDALDHPRTARDIMVTGAYGNLHEASMSDFLDALIIIRDATVALTDLLHALHSDGSDRLDVDVHASILPPLAATTTNQGLIYTRLGVIDDLTDALESNALDRFLTRGMDQLFSFAGVLAIARTTGLSANDGFINTGSVPAGQIWIITAVHARNNARPTTECHLILRHNAVSYHFQEVVAALAQGQGTPWAGYIQADQDDQIRFESIGGLNGDSCTLELLGHIMTLET